MSGNESEDNTELEKTHGKRRRLLGGFTQIIPKPLFTQVSTKGLMKKAW